MGTSSGDADNDKNWIDNTSTKIWVIIGIVILSLLLSTLIWKIYRQQYGGKDMLTMFALLPVIPVGVLTYFVIYPIRKCTGNNDTKSEDVCLGVVMKGNSNIQKPMKGIANLRSNLQNTYCEKVVDLGIASIVGVKAGSGGKCKAARDSLQKYIDGIIPDPDKKNESDEDSNDSSNKDTDDDKKIKRALRKDMSDFGEILIDYACDTTDNIDNEKMSNMKGYLLKSACPNIQGDD